MLGGIINPIVDDVIFTAAPYSLSYPSFFISGPSILPIAEAEAIADPAIAPISIAEIILINAKPPGKLPTSVFAKRIRRCAIPPFDIN